MSFAIRLYPEPLRSLSAGSIPNSAGLYTAIGGSNAPFLNPCRIFHLQNLTDVSLTFSWDGLVDHLVLPTNAFILLDVTTNKTVERGCFFPEFQIIYVRGLSSAPATGAVYLSVFFGIQ